MSAEHAILFDDDTEPVCGLLEFISTNVAHPEPLTEFGLYSMFEHLCPDLFTLEFEVGPELGVPHEQVHGHSQGSP